MDLASFKLLVTDVGQEALAFAGKLHPKEVDYLRHFQNLEKLYPNKLAQAALETAILRNEAGKKFPQAGSMYFTREALEQASPFEVSRQRSERCQVFDYLVDLACSIGSDTLNMGQIAPTNGIDIDPLRLAIADANAAALNLSTRIDFIRADLVSSLPLKASDNCAIFFDPARRAGGKRVYSINDYKPPLGIVSDWITKFPALGVKISPGVNKAEIADFDAELEFVSLGGELK